MAVDLLKLNDDKIEFILIGTQQQLHKVNILHLNTGQATVPLVSSSVHNLSSCFDINLKMTTYINKTFQSIYHHLHNVRQIRKFLTCHVYGNPGGGLNKVLSRDAPP